MKFNKNNKIQYLSFEIFPKSVIHAVFTRHGGVSPDPWNSLNVGGTVGDERERVKENRYLSFAAVGRSPLSMFDVWQVHSADVVIVNKPHHEQKIPPELKADAMLTDNPEVSLYMRFADCTPIFLYDTYKKVVGIVHAGWQGTVKRVAAQAVLTMSAAYGSNPSNIVAAIGPSIGPDHYEVRNDVIEQVGYVFGKKSDAVLSNRDGKVYFDLWKANALLLREQGVEHIEVAGICTACDSDDWFSHRAHKGKTGRFGAIIALSKE